MGRDYTFRTLKRGVDCEANYRLLDEPVQLKARVWETKDGKLASEPQEMTAEEVYKSSMRIRPPRKQRAARAHRPIETITVVPVVKPAPIEVVEVRAAGGSATDVEVAFLQAKVRELMGIVDRPRIEAETKKKSIERLEALFNVERKVR